MISVTIDKAVSCACAAWATVLTVLNDFAIELKYGQDDNSMYGLVVYILEQSEAETYLYFIF